MRAIIFAGAEIEKYDFCKEYIRKEDIIICCDGGMKHTRALRLTPDYILGDFDSCQKEDLEYYQKKGVPIKTFPTKKDETDMELGLDFAIELGAKDIILFGGIGSRFDHTLSNAHLLLRLVKKGVMTGGMRNPAGRGRAFFHRSARPGNPCWFPVPVPDGGTVQRYSTAFRFPVWSNRSGQCR